MIYIHFLYSSNFLRHFSGDSSQFTFDTFRTLKLRPIVFFSLIPDNKINAFIVVFEQFLLFNFMIPSMVSRPFRYINLSTISSAKFVSACTLLYSIPQEMWLQKLANMTKYIQQAANIQFLFKLIYNSKIWYVILFLN